MNISNFQNQIFKNFKVKIFHWKLSNSNFLEANPKFRNSKFRNFLTKNLYHNITCKHPLEFNPKWTSRLPLSNPFHLNKRLYMTFFNKMNNSISIDEFTANLGQANNQKIEKKNLINISMCRYLYSDTGTKYGF